jgi:acylphosphatase
VRALFYTNLLRLERVSKSDLQQREAYYSGTVQGVGFRYTVRTLARNYAVSGFVRNMPDGSVHLVAEGTEEEIDGFFQSIQAELGRYIAQTQETIHPAGGKFRGFEIRF